MARAVRAALHLQRDDFKDDDIAEKLLDIWWGEGPGERTLLEPRKEMAPGKGSPNSEFIGQEFSWRQNPAPVRLLPAAEIELPQAKTWNDLRQKSNCLRQKFIWHSS